jgi:hypothetical protein
LLEANTLVYWAISESFREAEKALIDIFRSEVGQLPFGNKIAAAQKREKIIPAILR